MYLAILPNEFQRNFDIKIYLCFYHTQPGDIEMSEIGKEINKHHHQKMKIHNIIGNLVVNDFDLSKTLVI